MWYSISQIIEPESLEEAVTLHNGETSRFLAGGSYLVADADPGVKTLININSLLENTFEKEGESLIIGAGLSLQELIRYTSGDKTTRLADAAKLSCFSKNIRNQRTIGGEVAQNRGNSELNVYLHALKAKLNLKSDQSRKVSIREARTEKEIITSLEIDTQTIEKTVIKRFAVLQSAPAFLILAAVRRGDSIVYSVGGNIPSPKVIVFTSRPEETELNEFAKEVELKADHMGSADYKLSLLQQSLIQSRDELWS